MNSENYSLLKEDVFHGEIDFPLNIYYGHFDKTFDTYIHWHDEMELIYITEGQGQASIDLDIYNVTKGDFLIVRKGALHYIIGDRISIFTCCAIVFNLNFLHNPLMDYCENKFISPLNNNLVSVNPIITPSDIGYDYISNYFNLILKSYKSKDLGYQLEIKGYLLLIIYKLFSCEFIKDLDKTCKDKIRKLEKIQTVLIYIHNNYTNSIPVKELANIAGYSEYHFIRFFKKQTGKTVIEFINSIRVDKSIYLLSTTDISITNIAYTVGFNDVSYYIRVFKNHFGISPHKFKKQILNT